MPVLSEPSPNTTSEGYISCPVHLIYDRSLPPAAFHLYLYYLHKCSRHQGMCRDKTEEIAKVLRCSGSTVLKNRKILLNRKLIRLFRYKEQVWNEGYFYDTVCGYEVQLTDEGVPMRPELLVAQTTYLN